MKMLKVITSILVGILIWKMKFRGIELPVQELFIFKGNSEYVYAYTRLLEPIIKKFAPELIFISAGFDSARGDPLGKCEVSPTGFAFLTKKL